MVLYTLDRDDNPVPEPDHRTWGEWIERSGDKRRIGNDTVHGARVSTIFLGISHNYTSKGPPILWETMVFGGPYDQSQERYSNRADACFGHQRWLEKVKSASLWVRMWAWLRSGKIEWR